MFDNPKTIHEQIPDLTASVFTISDSHNMTILGGSLVLSYFDERYGNYKTRSELSTLWLLYHSIHGADFLKAWAAWNETYNPIENYNGVETTVRMKQDGTETERVTHGKTTTNSTGAGGVVNETQTTSVDSGTYRNDTKNIQSGSTTNAESGTTTTTHETSEKSLSIDGTTYTADYVEGETKNRHGNLGVTSTQNMISQERDLRMNPIVELYLDTFISEYAYHTERGFYNDYYYL